MDSLIATAASGMRSRMETLDLLANNIANAGTAGYKANQESYNLYFGEKAWQGYNEGRPDASEMPVVQRSWTDYSQGTLVPTGNSTDVALASPGFFVVNGPNGPMYTRNGQFQLSKTGLLQTQQGYAVQGVDGNPIQLDTSRDFQISPAGDVMQGGAAVSRLKVMTADANTSAERIGAGYFRFPADANFRPAANPDVQQGKVEMSNVTPAYSAVKLVGVMRSFEMLQRAVNMASEMNKRAVEEVARVSS
jgi:flagellar basal body rod protein FlgG